MRSSRTLIPSLLVAVLILLFAPISQAMTVTRIVVFGDSLSDHGNLNAVVQNIPGLPAVPETWTNGDVWIDYLARDLSITAEALDNRAYGGAMTSKHLTSLELKTENPNNPLIPVFDALGLEQQVTAYVGSSPAYPSDTTLFVLWIGGNDINSYLAAQQAGTTLPLIGNYLATATDRIGTAIRQLAEDGARNFLVMNLPDLGSTPKILALDDSAQAQVTQMTTSFNTLLFQAVDTAAATYLTDTGTQLSINKFDTFSFLASVISNSTFPNNTDTLLVDPENPMTSTLNAPASDYLFWDNIHPTTRAHELLADRVNTQFDITAASAINSPGSSSGCFLQEVMLP